MKLKSFLVFQLLLLAVVAFAQARSPDVILVKDLSHQDHQTYQRMPFMVPQGVERLTFETFYSGKEQKTVVDFGLIDAKGNIVGWSGGNKKNWTLSSVDATPSYSPTTIVPGEWSVLLGIPNIREGVASRVEVKVYFSKALDQLEPIEKAEQTAHKWYRGDLHMHTAHSDGTCTNASHTAEVPCPVFRIAEKAMAEKLDFISITDHNTISQANSIRELQPYFSTLLMIPSRELTSFYGHANLLGYFGSFDFRAVDRSKAWGDEVRKLKSNYFLSINHPNFPSGEQCMGCGWTFGQSVIESGQIKGVEVANGDDVGSAFSGIDFWLRQLDLGYRLTAVAGSDNHHVDQPEKSHGYLGRPINVVYSKALTAQDLTDALIAGHVYIDFAHQLDNKPKREVTLKAKVQEKEYMMGDSVHTGQAEGPVQIQLTLKHAQGYWVRLHKSQNLSIGSEFGLVSDDSFDQKFNFLPPVGKSWLYLELVDSNGKLSLMTNPIYFDKD